MDFDLLEKYSYEWKRSNDLQLEKKIIDIICNTNNNFNFPISEDCTISNGKVGFTYKNNKTRILSNSSFRNKYISDILNNNYVDRIASALTCYDEIYIKNLYERGDCKINFGDIVVDIGANIGVFTRNAYEKGAKEIYSFEPSKEIFHVLNKNNTFKNIHKFNMAVSDTNGHEILYIDNFSGGNTLLRNASKSLTFTGENISVETITLKKMFE